MRSWIELIGSILFAWIMMPVIKNSGQSAWVVIPLIVSIGLMNASKGRNE